MYMTHPSFFAICCWAAAGTDAILCADLDRQVNVQDSTSHCLSKQRSQTYMHVHSKFERGLNCKQSTDEKPDLHRSRLHIAAVMSKFCHCSFAAVSASCHNPRGVAFVLTANNMKYAKLHDTFQETRRSLSILRN
jgi:hypothetical protein